MKFMDAVEHVFINYAKFDGRARRSEFWLFKLFQFVVMAGLLLFSFTEIGLIMLIIFLLGIFIPSLAVCWRRFHDVGRSGWWYFICWIPVIGWILLVI